jgi:uroporphyrinogen-III synthase
VLKYGIRADCALRTLEAESLTEPISNLLSAAGLPLILIHGNPAARIPEKNIQALGTKIVHLTVEMESAAEWDSRWKDDLASAPPDFTVFTGTYEVRRLVELLGKDTASDFTRRSCVVVMDDSIEDMLKKFGLSYTIKLSSFKTEDLVKAMADYLK